MLLFSPFILKYLDFDFSFFNCGFVYLLLLFVPEVRSTNGKNLEFECVGLEPVLGNREMSGW